MYAVQVWIQVQTTGWSALLRMFMAVRLMCEFHRGAFCLNIIVNDYSFVNTIVYLFKCVCVCVRVRMCVLVELSQHSHAVWFQSPGRFLGVDVTTVNSLEI